MQIFGQSKILCKNNNSTQDSVDTRIYPGHGKSLTSRYKLDLHPMFEKVLCVTANNV